MATKKKLNLRALTPAQKAVLKKQGVSLVYLFGSQVEGFAGPQSDVDIGVVFRNPQQAQHTVRKTYEVLYKLFSAVVPQEKEADVVLLDHAPITVQAKAAATGQLLYARSPNDLFRYREETMRRHADAQFYIDRHTQAIFARV